MFWFNKNEHKKKYIKLGFDGLENVFVVYLEKSLFFVFVFQGQTFSLRL